MLIVRRPLSVERITSLLLACLQWRIATFNSKKTYCISRFGPDNQTLQLNPLLNLNGQLTTAKYYINRIAPVTMIFISARGIKTFHPSVIS
jgi:hypothetical protein